MSPISDLSKHGFKNGPLWRLPFMSIGILFLVLLTITSVACNVDLPVFSNLKIEPARVKVGEEVTISVKVTIQRDQLVDVRLYIDGTLVETQSEFINPSKTFIFKRTENTPGTYSVDIQGLTGSYTVDPLPLPAQSPITYTITASSDIHGSISPAGVVPVNSGSNRALVINANLGYQIDNVMVDGVLVGAVASYDFNNVTANHTISASFVSSAPTTLSTPSPTPPLTTPSTTTTSALVPVTINFDQLTVPASGAATFPKDQYKSLGVIIFLPQKDYFVTVRHLLTGNGAYSQPYSISFGNTGVEVEFVNPSTGVDSVTNLVSAWVGDKSGERDEITMTAYDINGQVIATTIYVSQPQNRLDNATDFGLVEIRREGIHRIVFTDNNSSGADMDDFTFNPPNAP
jgi:hypothetical protein